MSKNILESFYIIDENDKIRHAKDLEEWFEFFNFENRKIKRDEFGHYAVSTVFLSVDHRFTPDGDPILFETMVFDLKRGSTYDIECIRSTNKIDALKIHNEMVKKWSDKCQKNT